MAPVVTLCRSGEKYFQQRLGVTLSQCRGFPFYQWKCQQVLNSNTERIIVFSKCQFTIPAVEVPFKTYRCSTIQPRSSHNETTYPGSSNSSYFLGAISQSAPLVLAQNRLTNQMLQTLRFSHDLMRKGTQCPSFYQSGTQYPHRYRVPAPR